MKVLELYKKEENLRIQKLKNKRIQLFMFAKWIVLAVLVGVLVGGFGSLFGLCMEYATQTRMKYDWLIFLLPVAGVFIVWIYRSSRIKKDIGTNLVIDTVHNSGGVPFRVAPLIFISTVLTHLVGGSAGREGAALQIGGSFGDKIGRVLKMDLMDRKILILCGMSAAFSALFGTPMAAAVFSMEVITVGVMYYAAFLPCVVASLVASNFASNIVGISPESFQISYVPELDMKMLGVVIIISVVGAVVSSLFCLILHRTSKEFSERIKNPYIRIIIAGVCIIGLTLIVGNRDYNGAGIDVIKRAFEGDIVPYAFLLKMLFTAITLGGGFKGGEIVPTFFVGATLGSAIGSALGVAPSLCAGIGMAVLFCGVTNCPLATLFISFELFNYKAVSYFLLAIAISYVLSGYSGLYGEQKIMYSKYKARYINRNVKDHE
jgi:H+/Cl- antiporter ClcA